MSNAKEVNLSLKVMINEQKTKVLFAEADSDLVDVLLSFLTLPLGAIARVLKKQYGDEAPVIGSLTTLYDGLSNLDSALFWTESGKQMLLNPRSSFEAECRKLKLNIDDTQPVKYFRCGDRDCKRKRFPLISMYHDTVKCDCGKSLSKAMGTIESISTQGDIDGDGGGVFTKERVSFLITDELQMAPNVPGSVIQTLINLGITVTSGAELITVTLGFNEIMDLLRGSLISNTPLTDLVLHKSCRNHVLVGNLPHRMQGESSSDSKKMTVKAILRKSDNKLLFVQAEEDFVDFLFGLLIIPLGGVECLLGGNTLLKNIDNLYRSITNLVDDKYLTTPGIKNRLIKPELPANYLSKNQIFSLSEQTNPTIYFFESVTVSPDYNIEKGSWMRFKDPKGEGSYVKRPGTFAVTDDLAVRRFFDSSVHKAMNIGLSELEELELHIGLEEALNILNASLTSSYALSDGLIIPRILKQPVQEH